VLTPGGTPHLFGMGPDGVVTRRLPRTRPARKRDWELIPTDGAESVSILALDDRRAALIAVTHGTARLAYHMLTRSAAPASPAPTDWTVIGEELQPGVTALRLPDGTAVLIGLGREGDVRATHLRDRGARDTCWPSLGGHFVGRVGALGVGDGVDLFAVTSSGQVQTMTWHVDSAEHGYWRSLGGASITHVFARADEDGAHLFAVTSDRMILTMSRTSGGWPSEWTELTTLDDALTIGRADVPVGPPPGVPSYSPAPATSGTLGV
jgi:hypothetical protein